VNWLVSKIGYTNKIMGQMEHSRKQQTQKFLLHPKEHRKLTYIGYQKLGVGFRR